MLGWLTGLVGWLAGSWVGLWVVLWKALESAETGRWLCNDEPVCCTKPVPKPVTTEQLTNWVTVAATELRCPVCHSSHPLLQPALN